MHGREESEGTSAPAPGEAGLPSGSFSALLEDLARVPEERLGDWAGPLRPGAVVGRFEILRELGRGGFGVVYEARDRELGRLVAFKAVRPGKRAQSQLRQEWLRREAEAAAQLSHPNIVSLYDLGQAESGPYLVLELLQGESLDRRIEHGPIPVPEAVRIGVEVARALLHAHASGVIHRDLKPANVFLTQDGGVKVLDFGLAHVFGTSGLEGSSGTPGYMAPEQWRGEAEDERTDVFAMGVLLYEMLTGKRPFAATRERSEALDPGPPPALDVPDAPAELVTLTGSMLSKDPAGRPRNGQAVLEGLLAAQRALEGDAAPRRTQRWGLVVLLVAFGLAVGAAGAWAWSHREWPGERITVAVADFVNETRDPDLDGLSGLLITSLEQSRRLQVLTRSRMLDLLKALGKEKVERIDEGLAREVGAKAGARALLFASVRRFDQLYTIEAKGFDPGGNAYLFTAREDAQDKSEIPAALDRLSERTRQALRESAAEIRASEVRIAETVTPSLEAHRHYFRGLDCVERSPEVDFECATMFEQATAADPGFALAWLELASARWWSWLPTARDAMRQALDHLDRSPPRERLQIRAMAAQMDGREDEAAALFRRAVEASPGDRPFVAKAADFFLTTNDFAAAIPYLRQAAALDPGGESQARFYLADALCALGRRDELRALASELERLPPRYTVLLALGRVRFGLGERAEFVRVALQAVAASAHEDAHERHLFEMLGREGGGYLVGEDAESVISASAKPGEVVEAYLPSLLEHQGRQREALVAYNNGVRVARTKLGGQDRWVWHQNRADLLTGHGVAGPVWEEARIISRDEPVLAASLAVHLAYLGDLSHAAELAKRLWPGSMRHRTWRAVVLWRTGERQAALENLRAISDKNPVSSYPPVLAPSFLLGELASEMGEDAEAVDVLRRFQSLGKHHHWSWAYPRSLYLVARSLERLGRRDEARAEIEHLLRLWKNADPDLPLLAEARALGARLGAAAR